MKKRKKKKRPTKWQKLQRITKREDKRLGAQGAVNTRAFWQRQKFGPASAVRKIQVDETDNH